jgi:hypothetical protein
MTSAKNEVSSCDAWAPQTPQTLQTTQSDFLPAYRHLGAPRREPCVSWSTDDVAKAKDENLLPSLKDVVPTSKDELVFWT